ncbi:CobW family GTP-binding protein [Halomarina oriensis]|uniref:GTP-binding protein n=1 Tax=Halomarina oriensis TaxID=671145 RepID=A0A6B0GKT1_9EURY|nr:GTP-binding protein [Halomarina oriensis]MWG35354.1 GTP-binding protein [Halomarina oriensis]
MSATHGGVVPVTVVTGVLGAGKTTLVNRLLRDPGGRDVAVVVNDMGEVNVDAELVERTDDGIVDLSNGCICCRLQGDLLTSLERLAAEREFDALVVEASGISEPVPIARTLTVGDGERDPPDGYRLDTMVSVVDAYGFWKEFDAGESLPESHDPTRPLADVLVDGIEFCDVLLLNKCDLVPDDVLDEMAAVIGRLQPRAARYRTVESDVPPEAVLDTGRFDFEAASREQGWKRELAGEAETDGADGDGHGHDHGEQSAAAAHGIESTVYRRERPFDPARFDTWLDEWDGSVVRAKGFCWLTSRPDTVVGYSQAGPSVRVGPIGEWGEDDPATRLVFIGRTLDREALVAALDDCLATDEERATPPDAEDDPFPRETVLG